MGATLIDTKQDLELDPGQSVDRVWNNATPAHAVWYANAFPLNSGQPVSQETKLEVTRLWRRFTHNKKTNKQEHEIWYTVKNVGTQKARFNVYLSIIS